MTIAALTQVYDETRRLAGAGSVVAKGDFRLKKLVAPLEQSGAKVPVFAKVADAVKAVTDGPDDQTAGALLELASLTSAVLVTQGETGLAGDLTPVTPIDLGAAVVQTRASALKPLLEALTTTGSGRIEVVKDAHAQGIFRDLRVVRHAVAAIDDPYAELGDFIAEQVLPTYGTAIVPELLAKFDPKGVKGHPRRLALLHKLAPDAARPLVLTALETGSKEVKVAAVGCLGADDLSYLLEQASAKAEAVRGAALQALAPIADPAAVRAFEKALAGKDCGLACGVIRADASPALAGLVRAAVTATHAELMAEPDKKAVTVRADRLRTLIYALAGRADADSEALIVSLFAGRAATAKVKGDSRGGSDVVETVINVMRRGSARLKTALVDAHAELDGDELAVAVAAGRDALPADRVYDVFAPYVMPARKSGKAFESKRDAVLRGLGADRLMNYWYAMVYPQHYHNHQGPPLDPRWLDLAVTHKLLGLAAAAARPGHAGLTGYLAAEFAARMKSPGKYDDIDDLLGLMIYTTHPAAAESLAAAAAGLAGKARHQFYWLHKYIPLLSKAAIPTLEPVAAKLPGGEADAWLAAVEDLRAKPDTPSEP